MQSKMKVSARTLIQMAVAASLVSAVSFLPAVAQQDTSSVDTQARVQAYKAWHEQVERLGPPTEGCFRITYPSTVFVKHACGSGTSYVATRHMPSIHALAAGNTGNDYYAQASSAIKSVTGSFPSATGIKSVTSVYPDNEGSSAGEYTLQLNTNMAAGSNALCTADSQKSGCYVWEQFVYGTDQGNNGNPTVLIQTWLFPSNPGAITTEAQYEAFEEAVERIRCPSSWTKSVQGGGCYHNAVSTETVPLIAASALANAKLEGTVTANGSDVGYLTFAGGSGTPTIETVSQSDTVADFAANWKGAEFNVVGDGGGSNANFNSGSSVTVNVAVNDGATSAPQCQGGASGTQFSGATGEGNNLTLGACTAKAGSSTASPYIQFTESN
jgi:hypothetical protein